MFAFVWATLIKKGLHHGQMFLTAAFEKKKKLIPSRVKNCQTFWNFPFIILFEKKNNHQIFNGQLQFLRSVNLFSEVNWPKNQINILLCLMSPWFQSVRSNNGLIPIALYCLHLEQHNEIYLWELHKWSYWFS